MVDDPVLGFLRSARAYGPGAHAPGCLETHMSWLFVTGDRVFKLKKPVHTRYLDHSTLARREFDCREEMRLNTRLAPGVYLGLYALQRVAPGLCLVPEEALSPHGGVVDWLVCMRRLPEALQLDRRIACGEAGAPDIDALADRLVAFYRTAPSAALAPAQYLRRFRSEQRINREVLLDARWSTPRAARALDRLDEAIERERSALGRRAAYLVDGHGDLRPEHVFMTEPPCVIDCLEFDARLRRVDPYDELAFLGLECAVAGAPWVATRLHDRVARVLGNEPPPELRRLYVAARALMRARLAMAHLLDTHPREPEKWAPRAERYVQHALALFRSAAATWP